MTILRRTERAMVRSMCGVKLVDRKNTEELMEMLSLKKTLHSGEDFVGLVYRAS